VGGAGRSNWLKGLALVLTYVAVAAAFFHHSSEFAPRLA
jgi:Ca2+/H+ antiporter